MNSILKKPSGFKANALIILMVLLVFGVAVGYSVYNKKYSNNKPCPAGQVPMHGQFADGPSKGYTCEGPNGTIVP